MTDQLGVTLAGLGLEPELIAELEQTGRLMRVGEDVPLISPGMRAMALPLVIEGTLRIMREDAEGNEIFLYYLEGGDACAMSISCCLGTQISQFKAVAETDTVLWMVPMNLVDEWMGKYRSFRKFVIDSYQQRFDELMQTVDSIAFMNMDERLMRYLLDKKQSSGSYVIHKTHEQIAQELNTSRVVVSRLLKKLEREEKVELFRNRVEVM
ncbi:MAG: Crp/Fnr family transcriptional regulator [Roseivirga sp.]|nr:Crp/Fnr family transcriptional regulator [Roseivirga sp.]